MLGNEKFDRGERLKAHREGTVKRMACESVILAVQERTGVNYDGQWNMEGNGYISDKTMGVNIHSCLAVTPDGLVLGALDQMGYNREEPRKETLTRERQKNRPTKKKKAIVGARQWRGQEYSIPSGAKVIHICDHEGDMAG
jgi:hypothetical protein